MHEIPIPRIEPFDTADITARYIDPEMPVVISGWAANWPARHKWQPEYLGRVAGNIRVPAIESDSGKFPDFNPHAKVRAIEVDFADYLESIVNGHEQARRRLINGDVTPLVLDNGHPHEVFGALLGDVEQPGWIAPSALHYMGLWTSGAGVRSWLHYDNNGMHNCNVQVKGRKRVLLFAPSQCSLLYPHMFVKHGPGSSQFSQVDVAAPDLERFPRFADAMAMVTVLEEGDAVFFPAYWYHSFEHLGAINVNVNFWWRPARYLLNAVTIRRRLWSALARVLLPEEEQPKAAAITAALRALPAETRAVLAALEEKLQG